MRFMYFYEICLVFNDLFLIEYSRTSYTGGIYMKHRDPKVEKSKPRPTCNIAVEGFHYLALFVIGCMILWSAGHTIFEIITVKNHLPRLTIFYYCLFT